MRKYMAKNILVKRKGLYESPSAEAVYLYQEMNFCESDGNTENYGDQDPWTIPDND